MEKVKLVVKPTRSYHSEPWNATHPRWLLLMLVGC